MLFAVCGRATVLARFRGAIRTFSTANGSLRDNLDQPVLKLRSADKMWLHLPNRIYLVGSEAIEMVSSRLYKDYRKEESVICESSPGPGFLTEALLKKNFKQIHVFHDPNDEFAHEINKLSRMQSSRLTAHDFDMIPKEHNRAEEEPTMDSFSTLEITEPLPWVGKPPLKIFVPLSPSVEDLFVSNCMQQLIHQSGIYELGRSELYLFISCNLAWYISADYREGNYNRYRAKTVLINTLYDVEFLGKTNWNNFLPTLKKKKSRNQPSGMFFDVDNAFFVKLTPKKTLISELSPELWPEYIFFVKQAMMKRSNFVIPFLEQWIPDCGPRLIFNNIPLYTRFGDLSPRQFFDLFRLFSSWPEYEDSTFRAAYNSNTSFDVDNES